MGIKRREKTKKRSKSNLLITILVLVLVIALILGYIFYTNATYRKEFYQVTNDNINGNMRIVFLSDLHLYEYGKNNEELIADIKSLKPDLIVSGGDMVINDNPQYDSMLYLCQELSRIAPLYGVMGNHEDQRVYISKDEKLRSRFENAGMRLLVNESETIEISGNTVELVGLAGTDTNFDEYGAKEFMDSLPSKSADIRICIAHVPILFKEKLKEYSFDLGLSGHVHGGLMKFPKLGGIYTDEEGFMPKLYSGLYELENAPLIINRGMGDSRMIPRINNPHELSVIDFKWY